jgi:hypothetical protein
VRRRGGRVESASMCEQRCGACAVPDFAVEVGDSGDGYGRMGVVVHGAADTQVQRSHGRVRPVWGITRWSGEAQACRLPAPALLAMLAVGVAVGGVREHGGVLAATWMVSAVDDAPVCRESDGPADAAVRDISEGEWAAVRVEC